MPKQISHGKFEVDPAYDKDADLAAEIAKIRNSLGLMLADIDGLKSSTLQLVNMFSLIDCLAQEEANYPQGAWASKKAFCQFILTHQKQCDYLEKVDPITLYYRVEEFIEEVVLIPGFPPEKEIDIEDWDLYGERVKDVLQSGKSAEILSYIKKKKGSDFAARMENDHRLVSLLYRMWSKAVHEMSGLGEICPLDENIEETEPFYRSIGRGYIQGENWVSDDVIELVIPNAFIRNILVDCIDGYLENCSTNKRFPFSNNQMTRTHKLSWYDN